MLLSLNMMGAADRVVPARLLHNITEKIIPELMVNWVCSFISNRTTTLCLLGHNINAFPWIQASPKAPHSHPSTSSSTAPSRLATLDLFRI
jgi:hypothetical protein